MGRLLSATADGIVGTHARNDRLSAVVVDEAGAQKNAIRSSFPKE